MSSEILKFYEQPPEEFDPLKGHPDPRGLYMDSLTQGTLLAGREKPLTWELDDITSEAALHRYRAQAEIEALINLAERGPVNIDLESSEKLVLRSLYDKEHFDPSVVIELDHLGRNGRPPLEHDVKAVEMYLAEQLDAYGLGRLKEWVHFGMTSEDTNNLAYNYMLRDATNRVVLPAVTRVADRLAHLSTIYANTPTLGTTHAQKASPTTVGKQFGYLLSNISQVTSELDGMHLSGKFSGAVGNHNPMTVLFPDFDYDAYARDFVEAQGFTYSSVENQRNNHLSVTDYLGTVQRLAIVGKDATDNIWLKILGGDLKQKLVEGEKGSSTMSHKINPWRLENSEALFEQAIALAGRASEGLVASRHERDLSDHDWQRAYGDMLGRIVAGYNYFAIQLDRLAVDETQIGTKLSESAEVLSELGQTAGRVSGDPEAYDKFVEETQGRQLDINQMRYAIKASMSDSELRERILSVTPDTYVGIAGQKAREAVLGWHATKLIVSRGVLDEARSVDAVFFDLDDTLHFGVKDEVVAKLTHIFTEFESQFTQEEIRTFAQIHDFRKMVEAMVAEHNVRRPDSMLIVADFDAANDKVTGNFDHLFHAPPQSKEIIHAIRDSDKKTGLVTTRGPKSLGRVLELHGFSDLFDVVIGGGDVKKRKPHSEPLLTAASKIDVDPRRVLYVGDDQDPDIGAARAAGMKSALVSEKPLDPLGPKPDYHWQSLAELARRYAR